MLSHYWRTALRARQAYPFLNLERLVIQHEEEGQEVLIALRDGEQGPPIGLVSPKMV